MQAQPVLQARTDWRLVLLVVLIGMVAAVQVGKVPAVLPALRADWGGTLFASAWLASVFAALGAAGGSLAGRVVARLGQVRSVAGGMALLAGAGLMAAAAPSWPLLLLARAIEGVGLLCVIVAVPVLLRAVASPSDQARVFSAWGTYMPIGVAAALLAQPLVPVMGWRGFLAGCALLAGGFAALAAVVIPAAVAPAQAAARAGHAGADARRATGSAQESGLRLAVLFGCYTLAWFGVLALLPLASQSGGGPLPAVTLAGVSLANALGNLSSQWFRCMGVSGRALAAAGFAGMGCCVLLLFLGPAGFAVWASVGFSGVGGVIPPVVLAGAAALAAAPGGRTDAVGRVVQGSSIGQLLGPPLAGLGADLGGWPAAAAPICAACILAMLLCFLPRRATPGASGSA